MDCQQKSLADCPANFLTNFVLNLNTPMLCASANNTYTTESGEDVAVQTSAKDPATGQTIANIGTISTITITADLANMGGRRAVQKYIRGLKQVTRYIKECDGKPFYKLASNEYGNVQVAADGLSATFDLYMSNSVKYGAPMFVCFLRVFVYMWGPWCESTFFPLFFLLFSFSFSFFSALETRSTRSHPTTATSTSPPTVTWQHSTYACQIL